MGKVNYRWEYKILRPLGNLEQRVNKFNEIGKDGWEYVEEVHPFTGQYTYLFKRKVRIRMVGSEEVTY